MLGDRSFSSTIGGTSRIDDMVVHRPLFSCRDNAGLGASRGCAESASMSTFAVLVSQGKDEFVERSSSPDDQDEKDRLTLARAESSLELAARLPDSTC
jgi:hypothetical protein